MIRLMISRLARPPARSSVARGSSRPFTSTSDSRRAAKRSHDLLARYRRPNVHSPVVAPSITASIGERSNDAFLTASATPVTPSLAEVPPPTADATVVAQPVPAMLQPRTSGETIKNQAVGEKWVQGVLIPPKPRPPEADECCMNSCVHCVYNVYAEDLENYTAALSEAIIALKQAKVPRKQWPAEILVADKQGPAEMQAAEEKKVESGLDPTMAAFLALESRIKQKQTTGSSLARV